jgi:hypothetical protein
MSLAFDISHRTLTCLTSTLRRISLHRSVARKVALCAHDAIPLPFLPRPLSTQPSTSTNRSRIQTTTNLSTQISTTIQRDVGATTSSKAGKVRALYIEATPSPVAKITPGTTSSPPSMSRSVAKSSQYTMIRLPIDLGSSAQLGSRSG